MNTANQPLTYNPSIQGLRAIAILLVLAAHTGVPFLYGGFIGVDVFFVISGYLITGLLLTELKNHGKLSLTGFYARRLKRLLPALLLMLLVGSAAIYFLTPVSEHLAQASAAASAAAWVSNFYFIFAEQNYFESTSLANAFLHTWSLGVEEQFYLIWPLLLILISYTASRHRLTAITCISLLSLAWCIWLADSNPIQAFYLMPSRIWQFGTGAIVWILAERYAAASGRVATLQLAAGLGVIIASALWIDDSTRYPSWISTLPTLGAALCLLSVSTNVQCAALQPLARGPLKYVGDISYSLYLWHWPVLVIGQHVLVEKTLYNQSLLILVSLAFAHISYTLIENPIRRYQGTQILPKWQIVISMVAIVLTSVQFIRWHNSSADALAATAASPFAQARADAPEIYRYGCDDWYASAQVKRCQFGSKDAHKVAVIWGDSIGLQWFPAIKQALELERGEWRIEVLTKSSCPIVDHPIFYERLGRIYTECSEWRDASAAYLTQLKPDLLLIGSAGSYDLTTQQWYEGTLRILDQQRDSAGQIAIIAPTYALAFNGVTCLEEQRSLASAQAVERHTCSTPANNQKLSDAITGLRKAADSLPHSKLVNLNSAVCPDELCSALSGNLIVFRDNQHLTASFALSLAETFKEKLGTVHNSLEQQSTLNE